jgi:phage tail sheath protein FI
MPEYLSPGVYVEEGSYNPKRIEGVSTSVAGFVGPTSSGPVGGAPAPLASFADFERAHGGTEPLAFAGDTPEAQPNFVAHAARAFFENGGRKLYVSRVSRPDGGPPSAGDYEGVADGGGRKTGLAAFEDVEEISVVAAPGSSFRASSSGAADGARRAVETALHLIAHAEKMKYRFALIDPPDGCEPARLLDFRKQFDSSRAALYYPWITVEESGVGGRSSALSLPPSGFLAGIYARVDAGRGVWKAPANEIIEGATGFESAVNQAQQEVLNPEGVNCLRFFKGRGFLVWGARTLTSDPEWKYVNVRRHVSYLEHSIDGGTRWAAFEPNDERLWAHVRRAVEDFLLNEWRAGALPGAKPEAAFFVRCDRTTMTQDDLDNGRLVCLVGVAPLRPAEFVIFRIGQWTASRRDP